MILSVIGAQSIDLLVTCDPKKQYIQISIQLQKFIDKLQVINPYICRYNNEYNNYKTTLQFLDFKTKIFQNIKPKSECNQNVQGQRY